MVENITSTKRYPDFALSRQDIERTIKESFVFFNQFDNPDWPMTPMFSVLKYDEGLGEQVGIYGYDVLLPEINGKNVVQVINGKIAGLNDGTGRVKILDIGCWQGCALSDCLARAEWRGKLELFGITACISDKKRRELTEKGVRLEVADAHFLDEVFGGEKFDLIISNKAIGYMVDSAMVLNNIWSLLEEGGVALISDVFWETERLEKIKIVNYWLEQNGFRVKFLIPRDYLTRRNNGNVFSFMQVAMLKNCDKPLGFPFIPKSLKYYSMGYPPILTYSLRNEKDAIRAEEL